MQEFVLCIIKMLMKHHVELSVKYRDQLELKSPNDPLLELNQKVLEGFFEF